MTDWNENLRYEYPLTPDSVVMDCGGYEGDFAAKIHERYGCTVVVLEPIREFFEKICERFKDNKKVSVINCAIGPKSGDETFFIKGTMTGKFTEGDAEVVNVRSMSFLSPFIRHDRISLLKLNTEGSEFDVLDDIIENQLVTRFDNIQVQFHKVIPDAEKRRDAIRERLKETHEEQWCFPWCWESWRIKA